MKKLNIFNSDTDNKKILCFETGLNSRSFARTKLSQSMVEPGFIVFPDGSIKIWKPSGVDEHDGSMRVWGPSFDGERLDVLLNKIKKNEDSQSPEKQQQLETFQQAALQAAACWIRAKFLLGDKQSALNPGAVIFSSEQTEYPKGSIFFSPLNLAQHCLLTEGTEPSYYDCPDLKNTQAAAFCAGAMLYRILTLTHPFPDSESVFQDMREGVFLPPELAAPGLDKNLCELIKAALMLPVVTNKTFSPANILDSPNVQGGANILDKLLKTLINKDGSTIPVSSLFKQMTPEEKILFDKEKNNYQSKKNAAVKTTRFLKTNKNALIIGFAAAILVFILAANMIKTRTNRPTIDGLSSEEVVITYYEAFDSLNHEHMETCIMGADKADINSAISLFVIEKVRQSYEANGFPAMIQARAWQKQGKELPAPNVFGFTDLTIRHTSGSEDDNAVHYIVDYKLWFPNEPSYSIRKDAITLKRDKRKNWRITEINRSENTIKLPE